uniref:Glutathione synthetase n=1 Tax=Lygus hesperus TaxID=30085 RepID=A0A0A9YXE9_LYGHE
MSHNELPIKLPVDEKVLRETVEKAKDWGLMHGVAIRPFDTMNPNTLTIAPHTLFPTPVPRKDFEELIRLQPALNLLMHKVAHDHKFLEQALGNTIQHDEFTKKTYEIYEIVRKEGFAQDVSLGMFRSDYLPDTVRSLYLQVEFNTISTSIASLASHVTQLQSYILAELGYSELLKNMPDNNSLHLMSLGLVKAWEYYGNEKAVVLFLVEDVTANICDQRFMEYEIRKIQPKIRVLRVKLSDSTKFRLGIRKELLVDDQEVAVVYYRTAYTPELYKEGDWETRLLIERSTSVKCPSVQYHLAGTKKVQQVLALPGVLEKFFEDPSEAKAIRKLFTELYSLDLNEEGDKAYNLALQLPENYVLKPQREGGGNNIYGKEIPNFLQSLGKERQAYILMGLISPRPTQNYLVSRASGDVPALETVVSELGIYGVILGSSKEILTNYQAGHMLRSKLSTSNEGGLAVGSGYLDSPYLV